MSCLVVIVNYRTPELVVDCLASLAPEVAAIGDVKVTVVDGASGDDSPAVITGAIESNNWPWAELVIAEENGGFAYGNNVAIAAALTRDDPPEFFWLLNPDTTIEPRALVALLERMRAQPRAGIVGSHLLGSDGTPQTASFHFPSIAGELEAGLRLAPVSRLLDRWVVPRPIPERAERTDWVSGASMLIRRRVLEEVGLLDDGYFLFFEEVDLCVRARQAGWEIWHEPASRVVHLEGQSTGLGDEQPKPGFWFDSRRRYYVKHHGQLGALAADLSFLAGFSLWRVRAAIQRRPDRPGQLRERLRRMLLR